MSMSSSAPREIVRVDCPDDVGLIHRITGVLQDHRLNIESNHEFVDGDARHFFFRAEVTAAAAAIAGGTLHADLAAVLPPGARVRVTREDRRPIVVCATREPHCLGELLLLDAVGELPGRIVAVAANHDDLRGLVARFGVPFHHVPHEGVSRAAHEAALGQVIDAHAPAYVVLARYMRILSAAFVARYAGRLLNIHHSFLPAFAGASPYRQAFARGVKLIGATAHFVTADLDAGPIIAQDVIPVDHTFTPERMAQAGRDVEKLVLARAVRLVLEERVFVHGLRTVVFG
ncbi:MAG: formyltetrahydrofolate deformylase [Planctomycetaceae bacterium]|jgi:formyltetrahydrofolate deformylase|nr:formyltetrahydrofolate deformylase [Planctomycetaceae bacterium]